MRTGVPVRAGDASWARGQSQVTQHHLENHGELQCQCGAPGDCSLYGVFSSRVIGTDHTVESTSVVFAFHPRREYKFPTYSLIQPTLRMIQVLKVEGVCAFKMLVI